MNLTKKLLSSAAAVGMAALCLGQTAPLLADDALPLGDVNYDGYVNASDAALILIAAANIGAGNDSGLTADQTYCADVNEDGVVNASDAALVLVYAAHIGAGGSGTLYDFLHQGEEPVEKPTEPATNPPDDFDEPEKEIPCNGLWSVSAVYNALPGDVVRVPIRISETTMGMNSYKLTLRLDAPLELTSVENGDAFRDVEVIANLNDGRIAATNYQNDKNVIAEQNSTVCFLNVKIPDSAVPGTQYRISFQELVICDYNMTTYTANTSGGYIEVK